MVAGFVKLEAHVHIRGLGWKTGIEGEFWWGKGAPWFEGCYRECTLAGPPGAPCEGHTALPVCRQGPLTENFMNSGSANVEFERLQESIQCEG